MSQVDYLRVELHNLFANSSLFVSESSFFRSSQLMLYVGPKKLLILLLNIKLVFSFDFFMQKVKLVFYVM